MQLPKNFMDAAGKFEGLTPARKQQIIEHFSLLPEDGGHKVYQQFQANGGPEAEFVKAIFESKPPSPPAKETMPEDDKSE
jgi:hypothetical protein